MQYLNHSREEDSQQYQNPLLIILKIKILLTFGLRNWLE